MYEAAKAALEENIAKGRDVVDSTRALRKVEAIEAARVENENRSGKVLALTALQNEYLWIVEGRDF